MKKILFLLAILSITAGAMAQQKVVKDEVKVKKTTTPAQKLHNVFSKHKHYSGTKTKHVVKVEKHASVVKP